jgi:hypothetical protein
VVKPKFEGGTSADRLNAVVGLADRADKILEAKMFVAANSLLEIEPTFRLLPGDGGSWLFVSTLPIVKMHLTGHSASTAAGRLLQIAAEIEAAL